MKILSFFYWTNELLKNCHNCFTTQTIFFYWTLEKNRLYFTEQMIFYQTLEKNEILFTEWTIFSNKLFKTIVFYWTMIFSTNLWKKLSFLLLNKRLNSNKLLQNEWFFLNKSFLKIRGKTSKIGHKNFIYFPLKIVYFSQHKRNNPKIFVGANKHNLGGGGIFKKGGTNDFQKGREWFFKKIYTFALGESKWQKKS